MPIVKKRPNASLPVKALEGAQAPSFVPSGELATVSKQIADQYGASVAAFGNNYSRRYYPRVRTGILSLDLGLAGGFLLSRGCMLYGEKSAGKTTTALLTAVRMQRMFPDMVVAWIDVEGTFDWDWFVKLGGIPERLYLVEPETGEQAIDMADAIVRSMEVSMVVTDSIAMIVPMVEVEQSVEDQMMGVQARLIGRYIRKVNNALLVERHREHSPLIMHINQFRMKIGMVFGDPRTLPGGKALEFAVAQAVEVKNKEKITDKGDIVQNDHSFKISKDKTGGRIREGTYVIVRDPDSFKPNLPEGYVSQIKTVLEFGARVGLVEGQYAIEGHGKHRSSADAQTYFLERPEAYEHFQERIIHRIRKSWGLAVLDETA